MSETNQIPLPPGNRVLIVGLSRSGLASARALKRLGLEVFGTDAQTMLPEAARIELQGLGVPLELGQHTLENFLAADWIVLSPGVPPTVPALVEARAAGKPILGELELGFRLAGGAPFVAITGTNGKSTTTMMVSRILETAGRAHLLGGNIGMPLVDRLEPKPPLIVAEVSSFQLEEIQSFRPRVGAILNLAPDHLDRYPDYTSYIEAKARMCMNMGEGDCLVYNAGDALLAEMVHRRWPRIKKRPFLRKPSVLGFEREGRLFEVMPAERLSVRGIHNIENALAAMAIADELGIEPEAMAQALGSYEPLPHRCQLVGQAGGVRFYDDSKGTNVGATLMTLAGFEEPIVLIAGGKAKGDDYGPLARQLESQARHVVLIGEAREAIARALGSKVSWQMAASLPEATALALQHAKPGDSVVLSPACSSYDMFRDYRHRGEVFRQAVLELERGEAAS